VGLAFTTIDGIVTYIREHSVLHPGDGEAAQDF